MPPNSQINSLAIANCDEIKKKFEGQEAIYIEAGVLLVRIKDIRANLQKRYIEANIEEIPTLGMLPPLFHLGLPREASPLRWHIGAGYRSTFSNDTWSMGYGGWQI
jgi:hypothetical protein